MGRQLKCFFADVFDKHTAVFEELGVNPDNGLGDVYARIQNLQEEQRQEIETDIQTCLEVQADLYMVNSDKGITNLHVPSNVIIDASLPPIIRDGGKAWGSDGKAHDVKAVIPDASYAGIYDETVKFCIENGAFDPATMGSVANVGLMAGKAEEYGSHDQTFKVPENGTIRVVDTEGVTLHEHSVEEGDIWRMCQARDAPVRNWVELSVERVKATGSPAVFWLDIERDCYPDEFDDALEEGAKIEYLVGTLEVFEGENGVRGVRCAKMVKKEKRGRRMGFKDSVFSIQAYR